MSKVTVHVGLAYHKDAIQVRLGDHAGKILANRPGPDPAEAVVALVAAHGQDVQAAVEARSGSADLAGERATRHGWVIDLAHPGHVARMKRTPDKTDWADARVIAELARVGHLPKARLAPEDVRPPRTPTRYRQRSVERRTATKLRVTALLREHRVVEPAAGRWTKARLAWLVTTQGPGSEGRRSPGRRDPRAGRLDRRGRGAPGEGDRRRCGGGGVAQAAGSRAGDGVGLAGGGRPVRSVRHRRADGEVPRAVAAQRLRRPAAGRRGADRGGQRGVEGDDYRIISLIDPVRFSMGGVGRDDEAGRQAGPRDRRGDRQPLDSLAVPPGLGRPDRAEGGGLSVAERGGIRLERWESPSRPGRKRKGMTRRTLGLDARLEMGSSLSTVSRAPIRARPLG